MTMMKFRVNEEVKEAYSVYDIADNIDIVHPCGTFKEAKELSAFWNECFKKNGTYMF